MRRTTIALTVAILLFALAAGAPAGEGCDFCGMRLAPFVKYHHRITLVGGAQKVLCSFACADATLRNTPADKVLRIEVADYTTGEMTDAAKATYVEGSDARPVMSRVSMIAFPRAADAETFVKGHGGTATDLNAALARARGLPLPKGGTAVVPAAEEVPLVAMPKPGKKIWIGRDHYFVFSFDKKPSMGTVIVKVEVFSKEGRKDTTLSVKGDADMPSMKGAHAMGETPFVLSKKGDYLLPVAIVMPGGWEITLTFFQGEKVIYRGRYAFDV